MASRDGVEVEYIDQLRYHVRGSTRSGSPLFRVRSVCGRFDIKSLHAHAMVLKVSNL